MRTPGTRGSNGLRYSGRSVAASEANSRPWNEPVKATISDFPDHLRANLNAASFASAPELQKNTRLANDRSEEHTSELQSRLHLVCRLLLEKKKKKHNHHSSHNIRLLELV